MKRHFLIAFVYVVITIICHEANAQNKRERILKYDSARFPGKVVMVDGTELTGKIKYDPKEGLLSFDDGGDSRAFQPEDIGYFEFKSDKLKRFYSIEYRDPETGYKDVYFFEILKELRDFALVAKMDRITNAQGIMDQGGRNRIGGSKSTMTQTETLLFMSSAGEFFPYLRIVEVEKESMVDVHYIKNKFIDESLLEKFTGSHYPALMKYLIDHDLNVKRKQDLIEVLDYYEQISQQ